VSHVASSTSYKRSSSPRLAYTPSIASGVASRSAGACSIDQSSAMYSAIAKSSIRRPGPTGPPGGPGSHGPPGDLMALPRSSAIGVVAARGRDAPSPSRRAPAGSSTSSKVRGDVRRRPPRGRSPAVRHYRRAEAVAERVNHRDLPSGWASSARRPRRAVGPPPDRRAGRRRRGRPQSRVRGPPVASLTGRSVGSVRRLDPLLNRSWPSPPAPTAGSSPVTPESRGRSRASAPAMTVIGWPGGRGVRVEHLQ